MRTNEVRKSKSGCVLFIERAVSDLLVAVEETSGRQATLWALYALTGKPTEVSASGSLVGR